MRPKSSQLVYAAPEELCETVLGTNRCDLEPDLNHEDEATTAATNNQAELSDDGGPIPRDVFLSHNGWSAEEQFKQVRQLYDINDDPKRKAFLDELFKFMQKRGTPINRLPIMAKSVLDLFELFNLVTARGGLVEVINKKLWQEIIKGLNLPSSITSAAFTLRTQYMKYLYPFECEKINLSSPTELQAAIDGNRRESRKSYKQYDSPSTQQDVQQMSSHVSQQQHHPSPIPNLGLPTELEQRMIDYIKLIQSQDNPLKHEPNAEQITHQNALAALEMSRIALWNMYNNNTSPPNSMQASPPEVQRNQSESPPHQLPVKRELDDPMDHRERLVSAAKRFNGNAFPAHVQQQLTPRKPSEPSYDEDRMPINQHDRDLSDHEDDNDAQLLALQRLREFAASQLGHDQSQVSHLAGMNLCLRDPCKTSDQLPQSFQAKENEMDHRLESGSVNNNTSTDLPELSKPESSFGVTGMQFKLVSTGDASKGDQQLALSIEYNGVHYEGVLYAKKAPRLSNEDSSSSSMRDRFETSKPGSNNTGNRGIHTVNPIPLAKLLQNESLHSSM